MGDSFILAVAYSGKSDPTVFITNGNRAGQYVQLPGTPYRVEVLPATSLAESRSATVPKYFVDTANSLIWTKYIEVGLKQANSGVPDDHDWMLYQRRLLSIDGR